MFFNDPKYTKYLEAAAKDSKTKKQYTIKTRKNIC